MEEKRENKITSGEEPWKKKSEGKFSLSIARRILSTRKGLVESVLGSLRVLQEPDRQVRMCVFYVCAHSLHGITAESGPIVLYCGLSLSIVVYCGLSRHPMHYQYQLVLNPPTGGPAIAADTVPPKPL